MTAEPKFKYGQQEQTVRNHNKSTALERSVLKYWDLREPNLALGFCHGS